MPARDPEGDFFGTAYSIRQRRYPDASGPELDALHLVYQDPSGRWPWEPDSDYLEWPRLDTWPSPDGMRNLTMPREDHVPKAPGRA